MRKKKEPEKELVAEPVALVKEEVEIKDPWWASDPRKEQVLERLLSGWPRRQIADDVGASRTTVDAWIHSEEFQTAVEERNRERMSMYRLRRARETNMLTDRVVKLASKALDSIEKGDTRDIRNAREWLGEYRSFRAEERVDSGENVQKHQHAMLAQVNVQHSVSRQSFKGFLTQALDAGVVDITALDATDAHSLVTSLTEQALLETDVLDQIGEEDIKAKFSSPQEDK